MNTQQTCTHRVTRYQWVLRHPDFLLQLKHSSFQLFLFLHCLFSQLLLPRQASSVQLKHSYSLEEVVGWITALTDTSLSLEGLFCSVSVGHFWFLMCLFDNIIAPQKHVSWITVLTETPLSLKVLFLFFCYLQRFFVLFLTSLWQHYYCTMKAWPINGYWTLFTSSRTTPP